MKINKKIFSIYKHFSINFSESRIGNFQMIASLHSKIIYLLKPESIIVFGNKFFLDDGDSLRLSIKNIHDPTQTALVQKYVKSGDTVIDIGAHIGYYTLLFAKLVGSKGHVYAFEPSYENFKILKRNVEINGYKNVTLVNKAVSNKSGTTKLYLSKSSAADHKTYCSDNSRSFIRINTISLNNYFKKTIPRINFIKIDIQGSEGKAILGMDKIISKNGKIKILTEFWPLGISKSGYNPQNYLEKLSHYNFKFIDINEHSKKTQSLSQKNLLKKYTVKNTKVTNILCLK